MTGVAVLGSTGSIGVSTLDVVARHPQRYRIVALAARRSVERLAEQCVRFEPEYAVMADPAAAERLEALLATRAPCVKVLAGEEGLRNIVRLPEAQHAIRCVLITEAGTAQKRIARVEKHR